VGAILGSSFLFATIPNSDSSALGSNAPAPGVSVGNAIMGEIVMTFVLVSE
jgi:glycerol uptake facilitator-like aquaporin